MTRFANLADAAQHLLPLVPGCEPGTVIVSILPNGVPAGIVMARALGLPLMSATLDRDGEPEVRDLPDVRDRPVIVVDDGVETGTAARLVGSALRERGARSLTLAVAVCPRESAAALGRIYDEIIAVDRPFARRDLRWHYVDFDVIDDDEASRLLADHGSSLE